MPRRRERSTRAIEVIREWIETDIWNRRSMPEIGRDRRDIQVPRPAASFRKEGGRLCRGWRDRRNDSEPKSINRIRTVEGLKNGCAGIRENEQTKCSYELRQWHHRRRTDGVSFDG